MRLLIDDAARARAKELRQFALDHRENLVTLVRRMNKPEAPGDDPHFVMELFDGFKVVLTYEQQAEPLGWCFHVSVSANWSDSNQTLSSGYRSNKRYPHPHSINEIMALLDLPEFDKAVHLEVEGGVVEFWFKNEAHNE